ncbi:MAG: KamA family radical SAM protein [Firmicutes bacterium]|nr:KamA family radical SAM protein [Bacillota bacterium]
MSILNRLLDECIRHPKELPDSLFLTDDEKARIQSVAEQYPICIPPYYLNLVDGKRQDDPIRKLCIPSGMEESFEGLADTSGENMNTVVTGMQHKYANTALILTTNQCSMYCRHCFRKRMVGSSAEEVAGNIDLMTDYIRRHPEIDNVILSGGDALINDNARIRMYLESFSSIDGIRTIRIATRVPVVLPARIYEDVELQELLGEYGKKKQLVVVTHFNHPRELTDAAKQAVQVLMEAGCPVRNQTVLLKGVNDSSAVLSELMSRLVSVGVMPYYVFQCRPAMGVMNQFQVPLMTGRKIVEEAKASMNGLAKGFRYVMSHVSGKIEILGSACREGEMLFQYHQAKDQSDHARMFTHRIEEKQCWLPDAIG